jgi:ATP adenylyltransferase
MQYVQGERGEQGCIFCLAAEPGDDEARYVLTRGERCFAILNAFPYNSGHLMVAPNHHVASLADLEEDESAGVMSLLPRWLGAVRAAYRPDGLNIGVNEGKVAGAGFARHVHVHVVPRWAADSNFMPVTADAEQFRARGMMLVADGPPAPPPSRLRRTRVRLPALSRSSSRRQVRSRWLDPRGERMPWRAGESACGRTGSARPPHTASAGAGRVSRAERRRDVRALSLDRAACRPRGWVAPAR